jgi:hypothetical protein
MSAPASVTIETAPLVIWAMIAFFVVASIGVLRAAWVARRRADVEAADLAVLERIAGRVAESADVATHRPLAA